MARLLTLGSVLIPYLTANAHHGQSLFDRQATITLDGIVTQYDWANPHVYVYVEVADDAGNGVIWEVEGQPPAILKRQGWNPETIAVGDRVVIQANPPRDPTRTFALGRAMQTPDGASFVMGFDPAALSEATPASARRATSLAGTWSTILERSVAMNFLVGPVSRPDLPAQRANPFAWSLTARGLLAAESFRQEEMLPGIECIPYTSPFLMVLPDIKMLELGDDAIRIRSEFEGIERIVYMNVATHEGAEPSLQGHSIGQWAGGVLVVDTANFEEHGVGNAMGVPSGSSKHLVERFALDPSGQSLTYTFELEDPEYLAEPVTGKVRWAFEPEATYAPAECDPENARRFLGD